MFRKSTSEIIAKFKTAVEKYDDDCNKGVNNNGFFSTPNEKAINRRVGFLNLLGSLTASSPEKTIKAIFEFYKKYSKINGATGTQSSRLIHYIEESFLNLCDIKEKDFSCRNSYEYARKAREEVSRQQLELARIVNSFIGETKITRAIAFHNSL